MKKLLLISLAVLLCASMVYAATPPGTGDIMGTGNLASAPGKIFRLVRYVPTTGTIDSRTLSAESIVIWDTTSDDGVTVTLTTTSQDARVAGIVVNDILTPEMGALGNSAAADVGKRNWGYVQTYGYALVYGCGDGLLQVGRPFATSNASSLAGNSSITVTGGMSAGFAYDTQSASGESEVFIRGLE